MKRLALPVLPLFILSLIGCSSSDDAEEEVYTESYFQFYNGSANSAATYFGEIDGNALGVASYGDASGLIATEEGEYDFEFYRYDADDQIVTVKEATFELHEGEKSIVILSGDYDSPAFMQYAYDREELADHFRLFATSVIDDGQAFDLYMSRAGEPFSAAYLLANIGYQSFEELTYWDPDTDTSSDTYSLDFDEGEYIVYLTLPGESFPIFESATISFIYDTEYVLALRRSTGVLSDNVEIDFIINSTSVYTFSDDDALAQFRVYNSLDSEELIDVSLNGNDDQQISMSIEGNSISDFYSLGFGDYQLSATSDHTEGNEFNNRLVTFNQGQSKAIIIYKDENNELTSLSFLESALPQVYDHQIQIANLAADFYDIDFYFVRKDETVETAEYKMSGLDYKESRSISLPSDYYELIAVHDNNEDTQVLLDRTDLLGINEEGANYVITIEQTDESPSGYAISVLH